MHCGLNIFILLPNIIPDPIPILHPPTLCLHFFKTHAIPQILYVTSYMSMIDLLVSAHLKQTNSSPLSSYQLPVAPHLEVGLHSTLGFCMT